jgi:hypothetical protein
MKKSIKIFALIIGVLFNCIAGSVLASCVGAPPLAGAVVMNVISFRFSPQANQSFAMVGVNKEIWLADLMENFYPKADWLGRCRDLSAFVENDVINLADAGVDPNVLLNNATYPITSATRTDNPYALTLDTLDTENTIVRNVEQMEAAYDKRSSVLAQHKNALMKFSYRRAAFGAAPASDATNTPVITTTGATATIGGVASIKRLTSSDLATLATRFDLLDFPVEDRILIIHPYHLQDLMLESVNYFNQIMNWKDNEPLRLAGFDIYKGTSILPVYNKSTVAKKAWGAAAAPSTDSPAVSIAFCAQEVFRADGSYDMFMQEKSPTERGDIIGFQKRFLAGTVRSKTNAAIVSAL